ncbi:MAG: hypothetical protein MR304_06590 [Eubacterium sp.]|nr:hypothetical protein [Eubacterium sp.]
MAEAKRKNEDPKRLVKVKLFKDKDKYSDDVTVVVNGTTFRIQRGVEVEVPFYVAETLRNSEKADQETETMISELTGN